MRQRFFDSGVVDLLRRAFYKYARTAVVVALSNDAHPLELISKTEVSYLMKFVVATSRAKHTNFLLSLIVKLFTKFPVGGLEHLDFKRVTEQLSVKRHQRVTTSKTFKVLENQIIFILDVSIFVIPNIWIKCRLCESCSTV